MLPLILSFVLLLLFDTTTTSFTAKPIQFRLYTAEEIATTVDRWGTHYSSFLYQSTAQDDYLLPTAGADTDCPFDTNTRGCLNRFLILNAENDDNKNDNDMLPHVLWSGELHGNERVGPTAVIEATQLLLLAVECHQLPRWELQGSDPVTWEVELRQAHQCRNELYETYGDSLNISWLARLYHTRKLIVVPTANALGYFRNIREEDKGIDPNRDFPYDVTSKTMCMQTIAARTLNELFQDHLIQLSLTFHGGMEVIGYEWGAPSYQNKISPDDVAQRDIADFYSKFAGGFIGTPPYQFGPMNDLVYPVNGGMEDWAYAASWDPNRTIPCEPTSYGGYNTSRTTYDEYVLRCFNMLVETSQSKIPKSYLGSSEQLLADTPGTNGHVTRNIRLALAALEMVQPYVFIDSVNAVKLVNDNWKCRHVQVSLNQPIINLQWIVGGSIHVDDVQVYHRPWSTDLTEQFCTRSLSTMTLLSEEWKNGTIASTTMGTIDVSKYTISDEIAVVVRVRVDQAWKGKSHIVNARTNPDYTAVHNGYKIQGRLDWYSVPLLLRRGGETTKELYVRYDPNLIPADDKNPENTTDPRQYPSTDNWSHNDDAFKPTTLHRPSSTSTLVGWIVVVLLVVVMGVSVGQRIVRLVMRQSRREQVRDFINNKGALPPGLNGYEDIPSSAGELDLPQIA